MTTLKHLQDQHQSAASHLEALREQFREADAAAQQVMRPALDAAKDHVVAAHAAYSHAWDATLAAAPEHLRLIDGRTISISRSVPGEGGQARYLSPGDAGYDAALARLESQHVVDAAVAERAYQTWSWRGDVRIDYYGDMARVTDGSRVLNIPTSDLALPSID